MDKFMKTECLICFEDIDINKYIKCHTCKQEFHKHCMDAWKDTRNKSKCVHCAEDDLYIYENIISCFCCFPVYNTTVISVYN
jgi:hypothetical protein